MPRAPANAKDLALNPVSPNPPKAAAWLPEKAEPFFADLVARLDEAGGASKTHEDAINLCAFSMFQVSELTEVLAENGTTYETTNQTGGLVIKARPEYAQCSEASRRAAMLLNYLGLTPAARSKVKPAGKKVADKENPFSKF